MSGRVQDKVAIVTGAARGVGLADANLLIQEGATVYLTDINQEAVEQSAQGLGANAHPVKHDVSSAEDWQALVDRVKSEQGKLDILVNNAAILHFGQIDSETLEGWRKIQTINTESVFLGTQISLPLMEASGGGSIVNMSSSAAIFGMPNFVAYSASKSAVRGITKAVAVHCHDKANNVRCNSIHPDGIMTDMVAEVTATLPEDFELDGVKAAQAASYMCMPEDVAKVVLFLASDDSSTINGAAIRVDKGATLTPPYG